MSRTSLIALLVFVVLTGLVLSLRTNAALRLQAALLDVVRPLHTTTSGAVSKLGAFNQGLKSLEDLEHENETLVIQNQELRTTNQMMRDLGVQNDKLRAALGYKERAPFRLLPARVIARKSATWWNTIQIDRGEQDGLDGDMPVVTDIGLVGKTTTIGKSSAYVLLVADENCKVAAYVEGTREQGILSGERVTPGTQPDLILNFLSKTAQLKPGQQVWSSGIAGGVFPTNVLLGTVREFQARALDGRARVSPAVDLSKLENVFVVLGKRTGGPPPGK